MRGSDQGAFENGRREHRWVSYYEGGDIFEKGNYSNGKKRCLRILLDGQKISDARRV